MMALPLVSVVIPSYNSATFVAEAVESALTQTYPRVEVIVLDDGSTDHTARVIEPYLSRVRYVRQCNQGSVAARNRGIQEAKGELLAFLDADDRWLPKKLALQVECLAANPQAGLSHTEFLYLENTSGVLERREGPQREYVGKCYARLFWGNSVCMSTVLLRRECLAKVGLFDREIHRPSVEDYDLWLRVARHFEFLYVEEPLVLRRCHENNASKNTLVMMKGDLYVVQKALREDPTLWRIIGKHGVMQRLFDLYFGLGYLYFDVGNTIAAHRCFTQALRYQPGHRYAWALWLATLLPSPAVRRLRALKQRLV